MTREEAKQLTETNIQELAEQLERGQSGQLRAYLDAMARFHKYSFGNILLIYSQCSAATHVAGFNTWKQLGRWVRQGEQGLAILAPMMYRNRKNRESEEPTSQEPDSSHLAGFRVVYVFDIAQTEGKELPEFAQVQGDVHDFLGKLKGAIAGHGITLEPAFLSNGALGASTRGKILIRPDLTPAEEFATLVHEFAHEILHQKEDRRSGRKTSMETEAEAVSYVVCRAIGLNPTTACSDYIQLYRGTKETLASLLENIRLTASGIIVQLLAID